MKDQAEYFCQKYIVGKSLCEPAVGHESGHRNIISYVVAQFTWQASLREHRLPEPGWQLDSMLIKFCGQIFEENCGQEVAQDWLFVPTNKVCGAILKAAQQGQAGRSFSNPTFWCSDIFRVELDWLKSEGIAISSVGLGRRKIASPTKF